MYNLPLHLPGTERICFRGGIPMSMKNVIYKPPADLPSEFHLGITLPVAVRYSGHSPESSNRQALFSYDGDQQVGR